MIKQPFVTRDGKVLAFRKGNLAGRVKAVAADDYDAGGIAAVVNDLADQLDVAEKEKSALKRLNADLVDENRRLRNFINNTPIAG